MTTKIKRFIVWGLEHYCLHHPWWYLGVGSCLMAHESYKLNERWGLDYWKAPSGSDEE